MKINEILIEPVEENIEIPDEEFENLDEEKLDWSLTQEYKKLPDEFIKEFKDKVDYSCILIN